MSYHSSSLCVFKFFGDVVRIFLAGDEQTFSNPLNQFLLFKLHCLDNFNSSDYSKKFPAKGSSLMIQFVENENLVSAKQVQLFGFVFKPIHENEAKRSKIN